MKVNVNEIKPGYVIEYRDRLWTLVKGEHVKPGKGPAYLQVELRCISDGTKLNQRFNTSETMEQVTLDREEYQFLYAEGEQLVFMSQRDFEQVTLPRSRLGPAAVFLQEGMVVKVQSHEGRPLSIDLPETVVLEVVQADPVLRARPPPPPTSLPCSRTVCGSRCRRTSRPGRGSSSTRARAPMSSAPGTDQDRCPAPPISRS